MAKNGENSRWTYEYLNNRLNRMLEHYKDSSQVVLKNLAWEFADWKDTVAANGVVLYGAGGLGDVLSSFLRRLDVDLCGFVDRDERKHGRQLNGISVLSVQQAKEKFPDACYLMAINVAEASPKMG